MSNKCIFCLVQTYKRALKRYLCNGLQNRFHSNFRYTSIFIAKSHWYIFKNFRYLLYMKFEKEFYTRSYVKGPNFLFKIEKLTKRMLMKLFFVQKKVLANQCYNLLQIMRLLDNKGIN